ncbi:MAG: hypothetical protein MUF04_08150 [Akkermansiaceae bacterium]|jgi:hypothetical protein|nr:hypothetical protein [Akkermansiaceae bacterium]
MDSPSQLVRRFERGEIERHEFQALMAVHARGLIAEIEEARLNPLAAWLETARAKAEVRRLLRKHRPSLVREILMAVADHPEWPLLSGLLWNAGHPDVPLFCFFRIRRIPVFRLIEIEEDGDRVRILIEAVAAGNRQRLTLRRDGNWRLRHAPEPDGPTPSRPAD